MEAAIFEDGASGVCGVWGLFCRVGRGDKKLGVGRWCVTTESRLCLCLMADSLRRADGVTPKSVQELPYSLQHPDPDSSKFPPSSPFSAYAPSRPFLPWHSCATCSCRSRICHFRTMWLVSRREYQQTYLTLTRRVSWIAPALQHNGRQDASQPLDH